jgi:hypothetical protein
MALPAHSREQTLLNELQLLSCPPTNFGEFNGVVGRTKFIAGISGKPGTALSDSVLDQLFQIVGEMGSLVSDIEKNFGFGLVPDWSRTGKVAGALLLRRIRKISAESGEPLLSEQADKATKDVAGQV